MAKNNKQKRLQEIAQEIQNCEECKIDRVGIAVPGEGNADAKVIFIGEAPGKKESETGRPFVGRSGKYLRKLITSIGLAEKEVFITSPVKYLPIYVTPKPSDIKHGKTHLDKQIKIIDPKIIVLLGSVASFAILGKKISPIKEHGTIIKEGGRVYFITIHPAAAIRFFKNRKIIEEDFKKLKSLTT